MSKVSQSKSPVEPVAVSEQTAMVVKNAPSLVERISVKYGVDASKMIDTLQKTCFKPSKDGKAVTTEQMMMLLVVADQYGLNPFVKEIYAFPTRDGGIQPVIGIDGWVRLMNEHPQFDGVDFEYGPVIVPKNEKGQDSPVHVNEWIECRIHRKDRSHPIAVKEYIVECRRASDPWRDMPRRMLRHKALIQCIRYAFGFAGYDEDDYERMNESAAGAVSGPEPMTRGRYHVPKAVPPPTENKGGAEPAKETGNTESPSVVDVVAEVKTETVEPQEDQEQDNLLDLQRQEAIDSIEQSLAEDMTPARQTELMKFIDGCKELIGGAYHQNFKHRLSQIMSPKGRKPNLF